MDTRRGCVVAGKTIYHHHHHYTECRGRATVHHHHHHHHSVLHHTRSLADVNTTDAPHRSMGVDLIGQGPELFEDELLPHASDGVDHFPLPYGHPLSYLSPVGGFAQDGNGAVPIIHWFLPSRPIAEADCDEDKKEDGREQEKKEDGKEDDEEEDDRDGDCGAKIRNAKEDDDAADPNVAFVCTRTDDQQSREFMLSGESEGAVKRDSPIRLHNSPTAGVSLKLPVEARSEENSNYNDEAWYDDKDDEEEDANGRKKSQVELDGYAGFENTGSTEGQPRLDAKNMLDGDKSPISVVASAARITTRMKGTDEVITKSTSKMNIRTTEKCYCLPPKLQPSATLTQLYPAPGTRVRSPDRMNIVLPQHRKAGRAVLIPNLHLTLAPTQRGRRVSHALASSHPELSRLRLHISFKASQHLATDLDDHVRRSPLRETDSRKPLTRDVGAQRTAEACDETRARSRSREEKDGVIDDADRHDGDDGWSVGQSGQAGGGEEHEKATRRLWCTKQPRSALEEEISRSASFLNRKFGPLRPAGLLPTLSFSYADQGHRTFADFRPYRGLDHFEHWVPSASASCTATKSSEWKKNSEKQIRIAEPKRERKSKAASVPRSSRADSERQRKLLERRIVFPVCNPLPVHLPSTPPLAPMRLMDGDTRTSSCSKRDSGFNFASGTEPRETMANSKITKGHTITDFCRNVSRGRFTQNVGWRPEKRGDVELENMIRRFQDEAQYAHDKARRVLLLGRTKEESKKVLLEDIRRNKKEEKKAARQRSSRIQLLLRDCQRHRHALQNMRRTIARKVGADLLDPEASTPPQIRMNNIETSRYELDI